MLFDAASQALQNLPDRNFFLSRLTNGETQNTLKYHPEIMRFLMKSHVKYFHSFITIRNPKPNSSYNKMISTKSSTNDERLTKLERVHCNYGRNFAESSSQEAIGLLPSIENSLEFSKMSCSLIGLNRTECTLTNDKIFLCLPSELRCD